MLVYISLSAAVIIAGIILTFNKTQKFEGYSIKLTLTISIATAVLVYPYFRQSLDSLLALLNSIRYGIKIIAMDVEPEVVDNMTSAGEYMDIYKNMLYIFYILAPIFGSISVLSFSRSLVDSLRMRCSKDIHIFSSLNVNSISIAEYLREKNRHTKIVFFNWQESDDSCGRRAKEIDSIMPKYGLSRYRFRKDKNYSFYQIDENESANLNAFIKNYDRFKELSPQVLDSFEMMCFTDSGSVELIRKIDKYLSSQKAPMVKVSFINEENNLAYMLFHDLIKDIDTEKGDNEFMIIGAGEKGLSILKTALWLFDRQNMYLTIDVVDRHAREVASELKLSCPDMLNAPLEDYIYMPLMQSGEEKQQTEKNYCIRFYEADVNGCEFEEILRKTNVDPDMVFVTMKDDILSQTITEKLTRIMARKKDDIEGCPVAIHISNDNTFHLLKKVNDNEKIRYFGNRRDRYRQLFEVNSLLESMSRKVHLSYINKYKNEDGSLKDLNSVDEKTLQKDLNESGYYRLANHESSLAQALAVEYRVKHILHETKGSEGTAKERIERYIKDPDHMMELCGLEHMRWLTYQRTEGWTRPTLNQQFAIARKFGNGKTIKDDGLLLHPANVSNEELPQAELYADEILKQVAEHVNSGIEEEEKKIKYTPTDYVNKDGYIMERIPQIISDSLIEMLEK